MKNLPLLVVLILWAAMSLKAQNLLPRIKTYACKIQIDSGVIARCGYLVVPENRQKPNGRSIKIPFLFVRKTNADSVKNISLYTTGGPGYSTIANIDRISASSGFLKYGGFIAFDQRGTKNALPALNCPEIDEAIKRSYRKSLPKQQLVLNAVKGCRLNFLKQGIDLSSYNTIESAADINDLKLALHIESLTLVGISYSGGLMLTVARNHPIGINALVLNSPLPGFVNYEEHGLLNINEALNQIFDDTEKDSLHAITYVNLRQRFRQYFTAINGKKFTMSYLEKKTSESILITYSHKELLDAIINRINNTSLKTVAFVINEIINGRHQPYITEIINDVFEGNSNLSLGMRYAVYCSEQIAYSLPSTLAKQYELLPWFKNYSFNNVDYQICACMNVKPIDKIAKTPVYSNIPVLLTGGDADPWCRPFYNNLIKRTMPNSQLLLVHNKAHGSGYTINGIDYLEAFMKNPYQKLISQSKDVSIE